MYVHYYNMYVLLYLCISVYRIFWRITRTAYYPHRHKNINFSKKIVVLPAPTDNPHQLLDQNNCCCHFVCIRPGHESFIPARHHAIFTRKMAAELILIAHFTNVILSTRQLFIYFKVNYSFNHLLTTVNTVVV